MLRALFALVLIALPASARAQSIDLVPGCPARWDTASSLKNISDPKRPNAYHAVVSGNIEVTCPDVKINADEAEGDSDGDLVTLRGHVVFAQQGMRLYADRAVINRRTRNGTFFEVHGISQTSLGTPDKDQFGGMEPDVSFWAREISKTGPESFEIKDGGFTSCVQATPRWTISGSSGEYVRDRYITFRNAKVWVKDVPVMYVPFIYYPITKDDRATGFLMPSVGSSGSTGFMLSNAFFWAISRNTDATFYYDYMKRAGNGFGGEYRFVSAPGSNGDVRLYTLRQTGTPATDTTAGIPGSRSYNGTAHLNQNLPRSFRLVGTANYFSNITSQHLYNQNVFDYANQTRSLNVGVSRNRGRYQFSGTFDQNDNYTFQTNGVATASRHGYAPRVSLLMSDAPIGRSRAYFGASTEAAYLLKVVNIDLPETNHNLWRFDARPHVQMPLSRLSFLTITTSAAWEITQWMESLNPVTAVQESTPLTRQLFNADIRMLGPVFARVWQPKGGHADRVKHLIEPNLGVLWFSPFDRLREVVQIDGTDFIVGGTTTISYGLTNRVLVRRRGTGNAAGTPGPVREVVVVDVAQSHYTNALASRADPQYPPCSASAFSAVRVGVRAQPAERFSGQFNTEINTQFRTPCTLGATGTLTSQPFQLSLGWNKRQYIPGLIGFDNPQFADHFVNSTAAFKRSNGHFGGAYSAQFDLRQRAFVQQRLGMFYNSQCCGISVDYQVRDVSYLPQYGRSSIHQFNFAFTLAGIGSFSNPLGSFSIK